MLSRTADHLFWMSRYMERAENTARMLDVNYQTSLLPQSADRTAQGWAGVLGISELTEAFGKKHGAVNAASVMQFMVRDNDNPSSILSCLGAARENARAVRGKLTTELWETTNQTWLEFNRMLADDTFERDPAALFEWVKFRSHLSRGVSVGTMLQIYRKVYRNVIRPDKVAELLMLRPDMPRSLAACMNELVANLDLVANEPSVETRRRAGRLRADLQFGRIDEILATGLHAFLTQFLDRVNAIGAGISQDFLVPA